MFSSIYGLGVVTEGKKIKGTDRREGAGVGFQIYCVSGDISVPLTEEDSRKPVNRE